MPLPKTSPLEPPTKIKIDYQAHRLEQTCSPVTNANQLARELLGIFCSFFPAPLESVVLVTLPFRSQPELFIGNSFACVRGSFASSLPAGLDFPL